MLINETHYERVKTSKTVEEVEQVFQQLLRWDKVKMPILATLRSKPNLKEYSMTLLRCMHDNKISIGSETKSLYDVMVDCITLDCIMAILDYFDKQLRLEEGNRKISDAAGSGSAKTNFWANQSITQRWLFPSKKLGWLYNSRRDPLLKELKRLEGACPPDLDREFLMALVALKEYGTTIETDQYILHPACIIPLLSDHPYFIYSVEKHWKLYRMLCNRDPNTVNKESQISEIIYERYKNNKSDITDLLMEWYQFFEDWYDDLFMGTCSVSEKGSYYDVYNNLSAEFDEYNETDKILKLYEESMCDTGEYYKEIRIEREILECRHKKRTKEIWVALLADWLYNKDYVSQNVTQEQVFKQLASSRELTRRLQTKLHNNKSKIKEYCECLETELTEAAQTEEYETVFLVLSELLNGTSRMKTNIDDIKPTIQVDSTKTKIDQIIKEVETKIRKYGNTNSDLKSLLKLICVTLRISLKHLQRKKYDKQQLLWYEREREPVADGQHFTMEARYVVYEPDDFIHAPCTKMFFTKLQREIWPHMTEDERRIGKKEENQERNAKEEKKKETVCTDADYYIGACIIAKALDDFYLKLVKQLAKWKESQKEMEYQWKWAKSILHQKTDRSGKFADQIDYNTSGSDFKLLQRLQSWFYSKDLLEQAVRTCQYAKFMIEYAFENWELDERYPDRAHGDDTISEILFGRIQNYPSSEDIVFGAEPPGSVIKKGEEYWQDIQTCNVERYRDFLSKKMYLTAGEKLIE